MPDLLEGNEISVDPSLLSGKLSLNINNKTQLLWNRHLACYCTVFGKAIAPIGKVIDRAGFVNQVIVKWPKLSLNLPLSSDTYTLSQAADFKYKYQ
ncbi:MAG: hypothetical protein F6K47_36690 [Symploca sp. SIO2E6]|nr:hypothetical protein [Symploca sp. SIO2E6]